MSDIKRFTQEDLLNQMGIEWGKTEFIVPLFNKTQQYRVVKDIVTGEYKLWLRYSDRDDYIISSHKLEELIGLDYEIIAPPKYTLTETEKHIVLAIDSRWKWLTRVAYGCLELTSEKPIKTSLGWGDVFAKRAFDMFHHHFQFIQWSDPEPVSLDELREIAKK